jgi:hypothetical protein
MSLFMEQAQVKHKEKDNYKRKNAKKDNFSFIEIIKKRKKKYVRKCWQTGSSFGF